MILVIRVLSISAHSLINEVGTGSRSHVLVLEYVRIFDTPSLDIGVKEDMVFIIGPDLYNTVI